MTINVFGGGNTGGPAFPVQRSVRLRSSASAYFNRTMTTPTNQKIWTWSAWIKLGAYTTSYNPLFAAGASGSAYSAVWFNSNSLVIYSYNGATAYWLQTTQVFRDYSSWQHIVVSVDTTQATSSNRIKLYVNGVQVTAFSTSTYPSLNYNDYINSSVAHYIGQYTPALGSIYFDGYITEINFIDGQALTPSSFGSINSTTGVWQPIKYSGTYGTNGFYLNFNDNSAATAAAIGKDSSGNGNNWTPNNISVTAGVTYDSMLDVPTLTSATNANFAVGNPLNADGSTWSGGNLNFSLPNSTNNAQGTVSVTSGKWYWEVVYSAQANGTGVQEIGLRTRWTSGVVYAPDGTKYVNGTNSAYGATYAVGDIIGVALDMDGGTVTFYKNNTSQGSISLSGSGCVNATFTTSAGGGSTSTGSVNFGQRPFTYTPPSGFKSLNTYNLPAPTIPNGATQFAATTYTGVGSSLAISNTVNGKSFQPDLVWVKGRSGATDHALYDSVRGTTKDLVSNSTAAETTQATGLTAFGSSGFTVGALAKLNTNTATYVGWQWKASNAAPVTNTSGSITSSVSANPSAGFSIVTYTGTGANATVGHGLGVAPKMMILKSRSNIRDWPVYHTSIGAGNYLALNTTAASAALSTMWNSTAPTSTVFSVGSALTSNDTLMVAYCFSEIAGYSKFGSYTGNGSTDGPFVYCGFRPKFVMIKNASTVTDWWMMDTSRDTYNVVNNVLVADSSGSESSLGAPWAAIDILSNGFKARITNAGVNGSGNTLVFMAFAESPFNYSLAR